MSNKIKWVVEQECFMAEIYEKQGIKSWKTISKKINRTFNGPKRTPKQCRERYNNYVKYRKCENSSSEWTHDEHSILLQKYQEMGSKWVQICKCLPGRSENSIKNRFYSCLRKLVRKINLVQKQNKTRKEKLIKQNYVIKLIQEHGNSQLSNGYPKEASHSAILLLQQKLQKDIMFLLINNKQSDYQNLILNIIIEIQQLKGLQKLQRLVNKIQKKNQTIRLLNELEEDNMPHSQALAAIPTIYLTKDPLINDLSYQLSSYQRWNELSDHIFKQKYADLKLIQVQWSSQYINLNTQHNCILNLYINQGLLEQLNF